MFYDGRIALMTNRFGFAAVGDSAEGAVKGKIDIAPPPAGAGGRSVSLNVFWMLTLASGSRNPALARDFMRHVATPAMDRLATTEGAIGTRRSTWSDPVVRDSHLPACRKAGFPVARLADIDRASAQALASEWNVPLAHGGGGDRDGSEEIRGFAPRALVVALGFDAHRLDPIGVLRLEARDFARCGALVRALILPTLIVQEGGYALGALGGCLSALPEGMEGR